MPAAPPGAGQGSPAGPAAPICWSGNGGKVTPGTWSYTAYQELVVKMLIDIARNHITTFVPASATICGPGSSRIRAGGDGMNCIQNAVPTANRLPCISQMCTISLFSARSYNAGTCQPIIATLNRMTAVQGRARNRP